MKEIPNGIGRQHNTQKKCCQKYAAFVTDGYTDGNMGAMN